LAFSRFLSSGSSCLLHFHVAAHSHLAALIRPRGCTFLEHRLFTKPTAAIILRVDVAPGTPMAKLFWQLCSPVHHCVSRPSNDRSPNNSNTLKRARGYHNFGYEAKFSVREQRKISESALSFHVVDVSSDATSSPHHTFHRPEVSLAAE
jgi:hypothetical protein